MKSRMKIMGLGLWAFLFVACRPPAQAPFPGEGIPSRELVWPQPPLRPRIRFLNAVGRSADLGIEPSIIGRLTNLVAGKKEDWFVRPTGVYMGGAITYVADPGAQALWILDPQRGEFRKVRDAGGQQLVSPVALAAGLQERIYLADSYLAKVLVYDRDGRLVGSIADANLRRPSGLAFDTARERLYVADSSAHRISVFTGEGRLVRVIGQRGSGDGEFNFPTHVAVDKDGNLYVTDALNLRLQMFNSDGGFTGKFGRHGDSSGEFASPKGVAVDSDGHIYVVDALFDGVQIFDKEGRYLLTFGERGIGPGQFWLPGGIFIDARDRIYVADAYNQRIQIFQYLADKNA